LNSDLTVPDSFDTQHLKQYPLESLQRTKKAHKKNGTRSRVASQLNSDLTVPDSFDTQHLKQYPLESLQRTKKAQLNLNCRSEERSNKVVETKKKKEVEFQRKWDADAEQRNQRNQLFWEQQSKPTLQFATTGYDIFTACDDPEYTKSHHAANREQRNATSRKHNAKKAAAEAPAKNERANKTLLRLEQEKQIREQKQLSTQPAPKLDQSGKKKLCTGCGMQTKDKFSTSQWNGRPEKRRECKACQANIFKKKL